MNAELFVLDTEELATGEERAAVDAWASRCGAKRELLGSRRPGPGRRSGPCRRPLRSRPGASAPRKPAGHGRDAVASSAERSARAGRLGAGRQVAAATACVDGDAVLGDKAGGVGARLQGDFEHAEDVGAQDLADG
jgi:hypothetical protein